MLALHVPYRGNSEHPQTHTIKNAPNTEGDLAYSYRCGMDHGLKFITLHKIQITDLSKA